MTHPLIALSEQEIFDKAYCGRYREQQEEYIDDAYRSDETYYIDEAYLDDSPEPALNLVCAGHDTSSEWLSPDVDRFWEMVNISPETVSPERKTFLTALRLTDHADREEDPLDVLREFAQDHGLLIPEIEH